MSEKVKHLVRFDWAMKNILRNKANFDILEGFLTSLLNEKITVKSLLESEGNKKRFDEKNNRVDLKCKDSTGREIIIEIQAQYEFDYLQRILFGTSKAVVERVTVGGKYRKVPKIISVNILYHPLEPDINKDYIFYGKTEIKGMHTGESLFVKFGRDVLPAQCDEVFPEYYFLCVGNFKSERVHEKIDEWMYFFKTESIKSKFNAPGIKEAEKKLNYLAMTKEAQDEYDRYMDALHYEESTLETAVAEGEFRGELKGKAAGKLELVLEMITAGLPIEQISAISKLTREEVLALKR